MLSAEKEPISSWWGARSARRTVLRTAARTMQARLSPRGPRSFETRASALLRMRRKIRADLPALLETRRQALVDRPLRGFADRAGDGDVVEELLFGADLAQPFVVGGRQRLARGDAGAGVGEGNLGRLVGLVIARDATTDAGERRGALLVDAVAVLQRQRRVARQRHRLDQQGPELALLRAGIDASLHRGLVPDRAGARRGRGRPGAAGRLRHAAAIAGLLCQQLGHRPRLARHRHVGADAGVPE